MKPNMTCMQIKIYIHHMEIDEMFDFINDRISTPPNYWINPQELPGTISGGFLEVYVTYKIYDKIRTIRTHNTWNEL